MRRQILVVLEHPDRIEQLLPYIDHVAHPDTKVVLLVHYNDGDSRPLLDQLRTFHTGFLPQPLFNQTSIVELAHRQHAAEQRVFPSCEPLRRRGVEIGVTLYSSPIWKVVQEHTRTEDVQMVIMHPHPAKRPRTLLHKIASTFHMFCSPDLDGVFLIHPNRTMKA